MVDMVKKPGELHKAQKPVLPGVTMEELVKGFTALYAVAAALGCAYLLNKGGNSKGL
jgi:hypothetical protein